MNGRLPYGRSTTMSSVPRELVRMAARSTVRDQAIQDRWPSSQMRFVTSCRRNARNVHAAWRADLQPCSSSIAQRQPEASPRMRGRHARAPGKGGVSPEDPRARRSSGAVGDRIPRDGVGPADAGIFRIGAAVAVGVVGPVPDGRGRGGGQVDVRVGDGVLVGPGEDVDRPSVRAGDQRVAQESRAASAADPVDGRSVSHRPGSRRVGCGRRFGAARMC